MTFSLMRGDEYLGPLSTISGFGDMLDFVKKYPRLQNLGNFLDTGSTTKASAVRRELVEAMHLSPSETVLQTLTHLYSMLTKVGAVDDEVIIADT